MSQSGWKIFMEGVKDTVQVLSIFALIAAVR